MKMVKKFLYCLLGLWQSVAVAVEFDSSMTATAQWMVNTRSGNSQSLNLTLIPELNIDFENDWQLQSSLRIRTEAIDGLQINDMVRDAYSDYSKPCNTCNLMESN